MGFFILILVVAFAVLVAQMRKKPRATQQIQDIALTAPHIELLSELTKIRSGDYFRVTGEEWTEKFGEPWGDVMKRFASVGLIRRVRGRESRYVVTSRGAAVVAQYATDERAKKAAMKRL